ncbi:PREDICTED: uncharacterized protein LOC109237389 [Nicotiana attenuata]|uniref:uncharacterized protein LOC109237389 n=1 Tax=Nicotiana attenuata TaxID=49451 RepID=UPI0009054382|nr:PREDICTED: uncharacterized protein LOC109237389 [Nicotiana attenuata]
MEIECEGQERRRTALYGKMSSKYQEYRTKHRAMADIYNQDPDFQLFREGLKQREDQLARKVEELREREEDLMKAIARNSELEASLKVKEDELELIRGVANLTTELDTKTMEINEFKGELGVSSDRFATVVSEAAVLEDALCVCRSELTKEKEASALKIAVLEGRVQGLEAELSALNKKMDSLKAEDVRRQSQPSTSYAPVDPVVPRRLYELWVHAEAQLDAYKALHVDGRASEVELRDVRAKARAAREACKYDPLTPDRDDINSDDANRLASDSWYEDLYATRNDV